MEVLIAYKNCMVYLAIQKKGEISALLLRNDKTKTKITQKIFWRTQLRRNVNNTI